LDKLLKASVIENKQLIKNHYLLTLHPLKKIKKPGAGSFFMLSVDSGLDPLLKRPFSIHRCIGGNFQLLYRVVGKGTHLLSKKKQGDTLEATGPLGNGFNVGKTQNNIILVAGGIGIAPVFALAETVSKRKPLLFYGTRTKKEALCLDNLKSLGIKPVISTDDGTLGTKGNIINVMEKHLTRSTLSTDCVIYACGPGPMLRSLSEFTKKHGLNGFAALEQNMACGLGTCLGCVVNTVKGYKRVCKEGPVFPIKEIIW
jgi:dihydroorotate dehydrogenase electron transfer subunit